MAYKNESLINTIELGRAIKRRREELKLSLRDVADVTECFGFDAFAYRKRNGKTGRGQYCAFDQLARYAG